MTPTLLGRLQTRLLVTAVIGGAWTALLAPILPAGAGGMFRSAFALIGLVILLGLGWELVYHGLQQLRWEKDWPTMLGLVTGITEGLLVWIIAARTGPSIPASAFVVHFGTTWLLIWAFVNGPIRVIAPRWRFRGGRFL